MAIGSAKWLGLSYFTYFFCYGIYLPFWGVWLKGVGLNAEQIGLLLGCGMVARFVGSLFIASQVKNPGQLITALRLLALLTCFIAAGYWVGQQWMWLLLVMTGFNLFFSPLVPLSDALAATWTQQIGLAYGPVRLWGSLAFVISSALTGMLVSAFSSQAILMLLSVGLVSMLAGMLLTPRTHPQGSERQGRGWRLAGLARSDKGKRGLALYGVRDVITGRTCGLLWLQRHLVAGERLFCIGSGLSVVAGRGSGNRGVCLKPSTVSPLARTGSAVAVRHLCAASLGTARRQHRVAAADCGATTPLR